MNEKEKAILLLEHKKNGYSILIAMKSLWRKYILYMMAILACLYLKTKYDYDFLFYIIIGYYIGTIVRDTDWLRSFKKAWPFTEKITDWAKVEELSNPTQGK